MNARFALLILPVLMVLSCSGRQSGASAQLAESNYFAITTRFGRMVVRLYDETPAHRDNFKRLAAEGAYDGTTFHRVIAGFMIQGGDPNSRDDDPLNDGSGGPGYTIPAEIKPGLIHKRGALATARQGDNFNPERASNGSQFYIVHGTIFPLDVLPQFEQRTGQALADTSFRYSQEARQIYTTVGGSPNLDGAYTVFGELVEGFDVLDDITRVATPAAMGQRNSPQANRPLENIPMEVSVLPDYPQ